MADRPIIIKGGDPNGLILSRKAIRVKTRGRALLKFEGDEIISPDPPTKPTHKYVHIKGDGSGNEVFGTIESVMIESGTGGLIANVPIAPNDSPNCTITVAVTSIDRLVDGTGRASIPCTRCGGTGIEPDSGDQDQGYVAASE